MKTDKQISLKSIQWKLFLLGLVKIPIIGFVRPRLLKLDKDDVEVKIRLCRRTKNHLNSMYFGALAVGADIAAGVHAFYFSELMGKKVSLAFKGISGDFLMRAETDVVFRSTEGQLVQDAMDRSLSTGERINQPIKVLAYNKDEELVATFELILSVKVRA